MKKTILGLSLALLAGACSPLVHPAVAQQRAQEEAALRQKQQMMQQQQTPSVQTAQPTTPAEGNIRQP